MVKRRTLLGLTSATLALTCAVVIMTVGTGQSGSLLQPAALALAILSIAWALLVTRRIRLAYERELREHVKAEAVQQERLSMAKELHDLVSNGLGMIALRASTAPLLTDSAGLRQALRDIEGASRATMGDLRALLRLLRGDDQDYVSACPDLAELICQGRAAGLDIVDDTAEAVIHNAEVRCTVARVVQEALANTARHSGPTRAWVSVHRSRDRIEAVISDEGAVAGWVPMRGAGSGLDRLRERCAALGGCLQGIQTTSGYRLTASIPDPL